MRAQTLTVGPFAAASSTNIRAAASGTAGKLTLAGAIVTAGVATMDNPRQLLVTTGSNESGSKTLTVTGTNWSGATTGATVTEVITLPASAGTVTSNIMWKTITSVVLSADSAGTIALGTNTVGASSWIMFDGWLSDGVVAFQCTVSGTINYTVQQTMDNPNLLDPYGVPLIAPANITWVNCSDSNLVAATGTEQSNYNFAPVMMRVLVNSSTSPATVTLTALQHGGS